MLHLYDLASGTYFPTDDAVVIDVPDDDNTDDSDIAILARTNGVPVNAPEI